MKNFKLIYFILMIPALLIITSCSNEDLTPLQSESTITASQPLIDQTAISLVEFLQIANDHKWFDQSEFISDLLKSDMSHDPAEIEAIETKLGISYDEFNKLILELGTTMTEFTMALNALDLSNEDLRTVIHDAVSSNKALDFLQSNSMVEEGRCFLQDACFLIGNIIAEVYLVFCNLFTDSFCEEEVLPLLLLVNEICNSIVC